MCHFAEIHSPKARAKASTTTPQAQGSVTMPSKDGAADWLTACMLQAPPKTI